MLPILYVAALALPDSAMPNIDARNTARKSACLDRNMTSSWLVLLIATVDGCYKSTWRTDFLYATSHFLFWWRFYNALNCQKMPPVTLRSHEESGITN
jgi:hypothetical protein